MMMNPAIFAEDGAVESARGTPSPIAETSQAEAAIREQERLARSIVDALSQPICVLDETGTIIAANAAWRDASQANAPPPPVAAEGSNYLAMCDWASGPNAPSAQALAAGIRAVLNGERKAFSIEYAWATLAEQRWFAFKVRRCPGDGPLRLVVTHEDITRYKAEVIAERQRLAHELHDAVTQTLLAASSMADALPRVWERSAAEGQRGLKELRQLLLDAVTEMRALLLKLRPATAPEQRLGKSITRLIETMTRHLSAPITVQIEEDYQPPADITAAFYRIAQEALNNIAWHAQASQISVSLQAQPREVVLRISDNGRGFDPRAIPPGHLGIAIMQERAASIGAVVEIQSRPGQGTQIIATWVAAGKHQANT